MVIVFQPYDPTNEDPEQRPSVLIIQTKWMRELAFRITPESALGIGFDFQDEPIWFAPLCSNVSK